MPKNPTEQVLHPRDVAPEVTETFVALEKAVGKVAIADLPAAAKALRDFTAEHNLSTTFIRTVQNQEADKAKPKA